MPAAGKAGKTKAVWLKTLQAFPERWQEGLEVESFSAFKN